MRTRVAWPARLVMELHLSGSQGRSQDLRKGGAECARGTMELLLPVNLFECKLKNNFY